VIPALAVLGATAALIALDPHAAPTFRDAVDFNAFNRVLSGNIRDTKMRNTALLAAESVASSEILATVLKEATNRRRPYGVPTTGNYSDTWFENGKLLSNQGASLQATQLPRSRWRPSWRGAAEIISGCHMLRMGLREQSDSPGCRSQLTSFRTYS
jgi:hypothetical protein